MIIQCKQCRTKFRFDESRMEGDGVWLRCSRCQHVFFHDNPLKTGKPVESRQVATDAFGEPPSEKPSRPLSFVPAGAAGETSSPDEDVQSFLQDVMTPQSAQNTDFREEQVTESRAGLDPADIEFFPGLHEPDEEEIMRETMEEQPAQEARKKSKWWKILLLIWSILIIIVVPFVLMYFIYPQQLERYIQIGRTYMNAAQPSDGQSVVTQVKLQDIRQRVVNNYLLGAIRVVEGSVVNQADYAVSRIQVRAEILDAYSVVLGQRVSYAGNVLSDDDLANLSEEEIVKKLGLPEGRDNSNDRVVPNGRIPFMIVFTRDQPGIIKTTVSIAGAEKLL